MQDRPTSSPIALLVHGRPSWVERSANVVWCATGSELAVLARRGRLRAAFIDAVLAGLDAELLGLVRRSCPVVVVDDLGTAGRWEAAGATVVSALPPDEASVIAAVSAAEAAALTWVPSDQPSVGRASLVTVLAAPGGDGTAVATSAARSLAATWPKPDAIVLADLTLDAPHRALHGLTRDQAGLPDLIEAGRFAPAPPSPPTRERHRTRQGYLVVPGLLRHLDWVTVGDGAAGSALDTIRMGAAAVIAHVDRDLEGESDTGSFDIEDRNVLARTGVRAADVIVVAAGPDRSGHLGVIGMLGTLARFGVPRDRILIVFSGGRRPWVRARRRHPTSAQVLRLRGGDRPDRRLGAAIRAREAAVGAADESGGSAAPEPQHIEPGTLGHWGHDIDGWITPRVPQQP